MTEEPMTKMPLIYGYYPALAVVLPHHLPTPPSLAPPGYFSASPYTIQLVVLGSVRVVWCMRDRECVHHGFGMQMPILMGIGTTVLLRLLRLPLPRSSFPRTGTTHNSARLKQRTTGLLPDPGSETYSLKDLELTVPRMPTVHRRWRERSSM